jgi:AraC-like DNA-binding protein
MPKQNLGRNPPHRLEQSINWHAFHYFPSLKRVYDHVMSNYAKPISLLEAASIARLEKKYFSRFFRRKVGITFTHWKQFVRIQKAIDKMRSQHRSVTEIAFSVGFEDLRTFQRVFKQATGMTPRQFRNLIEIKRYR